MVFWKTGRSYGAQFIAYAHYLQTEDLIGAIPARFTNTEIPDLYNLKKRWGEPYDPPQQSLNHSIIQLVNHSISQSSYPVLFFVCAYFCKISFSYRVSPEAETIFTIYIPLPIPSDLNSRL